MQTGQSDEDGHVRGKQLATARHWPQLQVLSATGNASTLQAELCAIKDMECSLNHTKHGADHAGGIALCSCSRQQRVNFAYSYSKGWRDTKAL